VHALAPPALTLDDEAVDAICGALGRDKKGGRFVLLRRRGEPVLCDVAAVDHADVRAAVRAMTGDTPPG
jgi:hypothetical protein